MAIASKKKGTSTAKKRSKSSSTKIMGTCQLVGCIITCIGAVFMGLLWYFDIEEEDTSWSTWFSKSASTVLRRDSQDATVSSRLFLWYYKLQDRSIHTYQYMRRTFNIEFVETWEFIKDHYIISSILASVVLVVFISAYCMCCRRKSKDVDLENSGLEELLAPGSPESYRAAIGHHYNAWCARFTAMFFVLMLVAFLISVPWEFIRLYQHAVSKKAAVTVAGMPAECLPDDMSIWQTVKHWLRYHFSWTSDPCEEYHKAVLVDPLWEVTPMMVISSAITRCVTQPLHIISTSTGDALRGFLSSVPTPWQPVLLVFLILVVIIGTIMMCGYSISIPFILHIEPVKERRYGRPAIAARKLNKAIENFGTEDS